MKIDMHAHTSTHRMRGLHTADASVAVLERQAEEFDIEKIVLMATYFPFKGTGLPNRELVQRVAGNKRFLIFGSLDAQNNFHDGIRELVELAVDEKIAGLKLYPGYQDFNPADPYYFPLYRLAEQLRLPVAIHTGALHHCCPATLRAEGKFRCGDSCAIDRLEPLAKPLNLLAAPMAFPRVKFVFCHLGNDSFADLRTVMRQCPNVYTDISGQFLSGTDEDDLAYREMIKSELQQFLALPNGLNRLLFATDFPLQSYADSIALVKMLGLSESEERRIFYENAATLLGKE
jgi:hypothetical protein